MRPIVVFGVPLPVTAGQLLLSSVQSATAGQPLAGIVAL